ncbi:MAG: nitroreductase [Erysipelotrichia bacterium]|nr:nitroreductase [Erysipelotrichia bacterium]
MHNDVLYQMIFKRKSFHLFRCETFPITKQEIDDIYDFYNSLTPLMANIKTEIKIVKAQDSGCKIGNEYTIMFYSETKDNYLTNIGYLGEKLDLYLVSKNIGTLWYGLGKTKEKKLNGLDFVIMMGISKVSDGSFRKNMFNANRKPLEQIWTGDYLPISYIVRFAPSACNNQPWTVENNDNCLDVYRNHKGRIFGILPPKFSFFFTRIDMGIFLAFIEICLIHEKISFEKEIFVDEEIVDRILLAKYHLK